MPGEEGKEMPSKEKRKENARGGNPDFLPERKEYPCEVPFQVAKWSVSVSTPFLSIP